MIGLISDRVIWSCLWGNSRNLDFHLERAVTPKFEGLILEIAEVSDLFDKEWNRKRDKHWVRILGDCLHPGDRKKEEGITIKKKEN
jgi:hypothetical protein